MITIEITGVKELAAKLTDPKLARQPMKELLTQATSIGQKAAVTAISGGTGLAGVSIGKRVYSRAMEARVYTRIAEKRAMSIEKGRRPGEGMSFWMFARWYKRSVRQPELTREEADVVREITRAIQERGSKGKAYMVAAQEAIEKEMPKLEEAALAKIVELAAQ